MFLAAWIAVIGLGQHAHAAGQAAPIGTTIAPGGASGDPGAGGEDGGWFDDGDRPAARRPASPADGSQARADLRGAPDHEPVMTTLTHHELQLDLFGGHVAVLVDDEDADAARAGLHDAETRLREWHARLTRFEPDSELSRLNRDARTSVPPPPCCSTSPTPCPGRAH